jgi:16S rRNA (cytidine1402-2'-O)-methyltransferase
MGMSADGGARSYSIDGHRVVARPLPPALYVVATPIGNLGDITLRALATLAAVDLIACEDTRVTRTLSNRFELSPPLTAYHEHNADRERPRLLAHLLAGRSVALVSDAGTPLVSDPGFKLVGAAIEAGVPVVPIPGASALLAAVAVAGLPTDAFLFAGFLPVRSGARRNRLAELAATPATLIFYESPGRSADALGDMAAVLGPERPAVLARELTKMHEEVRRGTLQSLADGAAATPPRGEVVLLVGPPRPVEAGEVDIDALLRAALETQAPGQAAAEIAKATGRSRKDVYARALALRAAGEHA